MRNTIEMAERTRLVTAEELERFPDDDYRYELVEGRLIRMSPTGYLHGRVVARFLALLERYLEGRDLGVVVPEVGFKLASNPDTVRGPDIAFIRQERIPRRHSRGFLSGPPDLVVEVLSPDDRPGEMQIKIEEYLVTGVRLVVVVDPDERTITLHRRMVPRVSITTDDGVVELGDVIPGFRCARQDLFDRLT